ncbi:hypothetical protein OXX59_006340 [Metschnikowia pulcherrima]
MSKLDSLLGMVDSISARSDKLVNTLNDSNAIISQIMEMNTTISKYDTEIDNMSQLVTKNNVFLGEFQKLYEKSFFLESNFGLNDCYTNDTSFSNLYAEYDYLWNEFQAENSRKLPETSKESPEVPALIPEGEGTQDRKVKNTISISNLNLKPLRCKESKVSKQKSRYRLSEAYTLNPLQGFPIREVSGSSTNTNYSNVMMASDTERHEEISFYSKTSVAGSPISAIDDLSRTPKFSETDQGDHVEDFDQASSPLLFKSLHTVQFGTTDEAETADLESHSPASQFEDFDNFHHFLRRSRINLKETFPVMERPRSHDSVLTSVENCDLSLSQRKFHNPADMIYTQKKSISSKPTVEAIYSERFDAESKFKEHSAMLLAKQDSGTHTEVVATTPKKNQNFDLFRLMNSPLGSPRGFERPTAPSKSMTDATTTSSRLITSRRKSVDLFSKSLASSFMSLVNTSSSLPKHAYSDTKAPKMNGTQSPPEKIKRLKRDIKNPIASTNDTKSKRLPPTERNLANEGVSLLSISANKAKLVKNRETTVPKQPTLRRLSQSLLTDALNESLMF